MTSKSSLNFYESFHRRYNCDSENIHAINNIEVCSHNEIECVERYTGTVHI